MSEDKKVEPETTLFRTFSFKGLELRDYFAAKAMHGFCSNPNAQPTKDVHFKNLAEDAFRMVDAMLAERERGE